MILAPAVVVMMTDGAVVTPNPPTLQHTCPEHAPGCRTRPNSGLTAAIVTAVRATSTQLSVTGIVSEVPTSRYLIEVFGNTDANNPEAEMSLGDGVVYTDRRRAGTFSVSIESPPDMQNFRSITATATSFDGAWSPLSAPLRIKKSSSW